MEFVGKALYCPYPLVIVNRWEALVPHCKPKAFLCWKFCLFHLIYEEKTKNVCTLRGIRSMEESVHNEFKYAYIWFLSWVLLPFPLKNGKLVLWEASGLFPFLISFWIYLDVLYSFSLHNSTIKYLDHICRLNQEFKNERQQHISASISTLSLSIHPSLFLSHKIFIFRDSFSFLSLVNKKCIPEIILFL